MYPEGWNIEEDGPLEEIDSEESEDQREARNTLYVTKTEAKRAVLENSRVELEDLGEVILDRIVMSQNQLALKYLPLPYEGPKMLFQKKIDVCSPS